MSREEAEADFRRRIENYKHRYETIDEVEENELPYIKVQDVGDMVTMNKLSSYLESRIGPFTPASRSESLTPSAFYLMNMHLTPRSIWLSRHGESMHNVNGLIGGDANLSPRGQQYAQALPQLVKDNVPDEAMLQVWTSTLKRTQQVRNSHRRSDPFTEY